MPRRVIRSKASCCKSYRLPKIALPTRTLVAPKAIAVS
jgi:hypothetical protein